MPVFDNINEVIVFRPYGSMSNWIQAGKNSVRFSALQAHVIQLFAINIRSYKH